jgi:ubiquitin-protein ligase
MSTVRLRRLQADYDNLRRFIMQHPRLKLIQAEGDPPERYQLEYRINSVRQTGDQIQAANSHLVEIALPRNYPRTPPQCRMLTPVFHPNIAPHAICVGDHWSTGEPLWSIVARIGEILAFQSYNTKSPLNGEAARWVDENREQLPLDDVSMLVEDAGLPGAKGKSDSGLTADSAPPANGATQPALPPNGSAESPASAAATIRMTCSGCGARYRVPAEKAGKRILCKQCQTITQIPAASTNG